MHSVNEDDVVRSAQNYSEKLLGFGMQSTQKSEGGIKKQKRKRKLIVKNQVFTTEQEATSLTEVKVGMEIV